VNREHRKILQMMGKNARNLIELTTNFLDLSQIEAGMLKLQIQEIKLKRYLNSILSEIKILAANKNLRLSIFVPKNLPPFKADPLKLHQVFANLLGNALKFTPPGGKIKVTVCKKRKGFQFEIADTGPGVPQKEQKRIFDKYRQYLQQKSSEEKGAGLGLFIARLIVGAHGGKIWIKSKPGKGSRFFFTLPKALPL
jgi:two-component system phosphate regulon sensor histidine kinase PhoR